jgi:hypothetical protein
MKRGGWITSEKHSWNDGSRWDSGLETSDVDHENESEWVVEALKPWSLAQCGTSSSSPS